MKYIKYHGLGNDYLVIRPEDTGENLGASQIRCVCHRNYGVGSDGILQRNAAWGLWGLATLLRYPLQNGFSDGKNSAGP